MKGAEVHEELVLVQHDIGPIHEVELTRTVETAILIMIG